VKEATRDGAPPIDVMNGAESADRLKELSLGVKTEKVEVARIEDTWFQDVVRSSMLSTDWVPHRRWQPACFPQDSTK
jgi:hypothetical protein